MALSQSLQQKLLQKLSPQQIQLMKLLQIPTAHLEERIKEELEENPALEVGEEEKEEEEFEINSGVWNCRSARNRRPLHVHHDGRSTARGAGRNRHGYGGEVYSASGGDRFHQWHRGPDRQHPDQRFFRPALGQGPRRILAALKSAGIRVSNIVANGNHPCCSDSWNHAALPRGIEPHTRTDCGHALCHHRGLSA